MKPRVLMLTGAYFPEPSGGGLQARLVIAALRRDAEFSVLTTSTDRRLPAVASEDGVRIRRVYVDTASLWSELVAGIRLTAAFVRAAPRIDVVNLHGFSRKAILFVALSRVFRKPFVLTLQTASEDEPWSVRAAGRLAYWAYTNADLYLSVSPGLTRAYLDAGLPPDRVRQIANAVDVDRFAPAEPAERAALRTALGLPDEDAVIVFVGYFSRDKRPDLLYRAWARVASRHASTVVFIGATRRTYKDVDPTLVETIRERAAADGLLARLRFVESTTDIERYFRAADLFVLPSIREGLPIALVEAMASGLPSVATRLAGSTDVLIEDGVNGRLIAADDEEAFARAISALLCDGMTARRLGAAARRTIVDRFSIREMARAWLAAYGDVCGRT